VKILTPVSHANAQNAARTTIIRYKFKNNVEFFGDCRLLINVRTVNIQVAIHEIVISHLSMIASGSI
jgi:hypothetical protein